MPYRDDLAALEGQCTSLEHQLRALDARAKKLVELQEQRPALEKRLLMARQHLAAVHKGRRLPLLDEIRVASPCSASWDTMTGDDRVRFCPDCKKNVYNLSAMTRTEGEQFIREKEGRLCARFYRRADGTVLTADCPVGVRRKRIRRVLALAMSAGLASGILAALRPAPGMQGTPCRLPRAMLGAIRIMPDPAVARALSATLGEMQPIGPPGVHVTVDPNEVPPALH